MADSTAPAAAPADVFAGNLAYATTDEGLKTFFSPVADDIISCQVILRGTRPAGYGFVAFNTAEAAQKAVDLLNKKELDGRTLIVEIAKPTEEKQKEKRRSPTTNGTADAPATKDVAENGTNTDGASKSKKKRNIRKPKKAKSADKEKDAPADNGATETAPAAAEPKAKKVKAPKAPRPPKPTRPVGEAPEGEPSKTMLFVANLGFSVDDAALSELFTSAGITVISARVVRRRWGQPRRSKGYGFVDVGSEEQQKKAIELLQGKEIGGREIVIKIAVNSQEREAAEQKYATGEAATNNVPSPAAATA
ncbi:related to single-stranded TG1-3 binding protein [Serendipita indica DSM 11827]|uniref:Related to single-stranded TG1-3 binding protein n=1 Tax=Serendipita indica (strain DSM 11827) TaxID=1109443 RepID=G4T7B9_SERID|nr:related to single-stranded TG1-3 binding protein [Serendipita indica DSM 11827]